MKKALILLCLTMFVFNSFASDILITNDSKRIEAKIIEVSKTEIRYKDPNFEDGPTFVIPTSDLNSILFSNGQVKTYNNSEREPEIATPAKQTQPSNRSTIREIDGRYYLGDSPLASSDVKNILTSNPIAYEMYSRGHNCVVGGTVVMSVGLTVEVIGLGVVIAEAINKRSTTPGVLLCSAGAVCVFAIGLPIDIAGKHKKEEAINLYNKSANPSAELQFKLNQNGIGLALNF